MTARRFPGLTPGPWDGMVVLCVVLLCACTLWAFRSGGTEGALTAVVYADGVEIDRVDLSRSGESVERTCHGGGYTLHVVFNADGQPGARVVSADCPTQDCVHTGQVTRSGQSIVCLPARIVIRLEGGTPPPDAPDTVLG